MDYRVRRRRFIYMVRRHPTRAELDAVTGNRPIYLRHSSGYMGIANSLALELLGIKPGSSNPFGGVIVGDPRNGESTELLLETATTPYASNKYRRLLEANEFKGSMSRKGNCWDNSVAESFFGNLKQERAQWQNYQTRHDAQ